MMNPKSENQGILVCKLAHFRHAVHVFYIFLRLRSGFDRRHLALAYTALSDRDKTRLLHGFKRK